MGKLQALAERAKGLTEKAIDNVILKSFADNEEAATNLNTDQLFSGQDSKGVFLPEYSKRSVEVFGKQPGPFKLFDTGAFYRGFFVRADKFPVVFSSRDNKTDKLTKELGYDIFGLQKKNLTDFARSYTLPELQEFVRNTLHV